jgi:hypothetical protein
VNTTTSTDTGTTTGRRRTKRTRTPQEMLEGFRTDNPKASAIELREIVRQYIAERAVFEDTETNGLNFYLVERDLAREFKDKPSPEYAREKAAARAALREQLVQTIARADEERVEAIVTIRLLEYETTYGKPIGDCTGAECARLSRRYGSFFAELSKRITRSETVRAHLSENELQAIARTHRLIGEKAAR